MTPPPPRQPTRARCQRACAREGGGAHAEARPYIRGLGGGSAAAARGSRGSLLSVSGRLGAGDCCRGAWNLALVPLRLLSGPGH